MSNVDTGKLRDFINKKYDLSELRGLCLDSSVDYENLDGNTKIGKITSLVGDFKRRDSLDRLLKILEQKHGQESDFLRQFSRTTEQRVVLIELKEYLELNKSSRHYLEDLKRFLEKEKWKEADKHTLNFMLLLAEQETKGIIKEEGCKIIFEKSKQEVLLIDKLWMNYSGERFGFSVQKSVFQHVARDFNRFCMNVGWRKPPGRFDGLFSWKTYEELTFDMEAERGHLPFLVYKDVNASKIGSRLGALSDSLLIHCIEKIDFSGNQ